MVLKRLIQPDKNRIWKCKMRGDGYTYEGMETEHSLAHNNTKT